MGWEERGHGRQWSPGLLLPCLTPTLVFPVMLKRKLKVRRREEPAQVPELRSSWLQLQRGER